MTSLIISSQNELVRVQPQRIVYISADRNYTTMVLCDKTEEVFSFNLSHFQELIVSQLKDEARMFIRIGRGLIVNRNYIYKINISRQTLILSDMAFSQSFRLEASKEALRELKQLLEPVTNNIEG